MAMLQSDDLVKAATKMMTRAEEPAEFSKLWLSMLAGTQTNKL